MEGFKALLFGISGLSMIFWVCVIALWHVDMFPRVFANDSIASLGGNANQSMNRIFNSSSLQSGAIRPNVATKSLINRGKYYRKSIVIADFGIIEPGYSVNRLYTSIILSLGAMSFLFLVYGLQSGFKLPI